MKIYRDNKLIINSTGFHKKKTTYYYKKKIKIENLKH